MTDGNHFSKGQPSAHDLDRLLAYIDGELPAADSDRLLSELSPDERTRLRGLRADAALLRALPAPEAPEELHEAIMAAAERAELFAGTPRGVQAGLPAYAGSSRTTDLAAGVIARPWAMRWRTAGAVAAMLVMALGVSWALWPRQPVLLQPKVAAFEPSAIVPAGYAPVPAPYAVVLEFDDIDEAEAALRSAVRESPEARLTHCCSGHCTAVVEGPPSVVEDGGSGAELMALADVPTHQLAIPAGDLSRILGTLMASSNGSVDPRRAGANRGPMPTGGTVELPIFIVPSSR